jgi:hypothetical protein
MSADALNNRVLEYATDYPFSATTNLLQTPTVTAVNSALSNVPVFETQRDAQGRNIFTGLTAGGPEKLYKVTRFNDKHQTLWQFSSEEALEAFLGSFTCEVISDINDWL